MSDQSYNPPVETHRDGAVSAKVWRNITKDGNPSYSVTFQRTYTDPATKQVSESRSFWGTDILKVPPLTNEAYRTIGIMREMDRNDRAQSVKQEMQPEQQPAQQPVQQQEPAQQQLETPQQGLAQQRDAAMENTQPSQNHYPEPNPTLER
ncbi:MAG: hypothetical protein JKY99_12750 [Rhizobiales bacterium]|nr:hypothetical protein [Hyphomicrobiales bacterium]